MALALATADPEDYEQVVTEAFGHTSWYRGILTLGSMATAGAAVPQQAADEEDEETVRRLFTR